MSRCGQLLLVIFFLLPVLCWAEPLDINKANAETIANAMKGVGQSKAAAIVEYRDKHGSFKSIDELSSIKGIGEKTVDLNREVISVFAENN